MFENVEHTFFLLNLTNNNTKFFVSEKDNYG
jgi:hypothetical protein